jgi:hypothetical protein
MRTAYWNQQETENINTRIIIDKCNSRESLPLLQDMEIIQTEEYKVQRFLLKTVI